MEKLSLNSFSLKELQTSISILDQLYRFKNNITVGESITLLRTKIEKNIRYPKNKNSIKYKEKVEKIICPSCEKGYLWPTVNYEGLNILSCKKCRYSIIVNKEEISNG